MLGQDTESCHQTKRPMVLGDAYKVDARIVSWETDRAVRVPASALHRKGADRFTLSNESLTVTDLLQQHRGSFCISCLNHTDKNHCGLSLVRCCE